MNAKLSVNKSAIVKSSKSKKIEILKISIGIFLTILSGYVISEDLTPKDYIASVHAQATSTLIEMKIPVENSECPQKNFYNLAMEHPQYQSLLSMILMAHGAHMPVSYEFLGCSGKDKAYPNIVSVKTYSLHK